MNKFTWCYYVCVILTSSTFVFVSSLVASFNPTGLFSLSDERRRQLTLSTVRMSKFSTSTKTQETLDPCVVLMKQIISKHENLWKDEKIYSLAQGVVYWQPPEAVNQAMIDAINRSASDTALHSYTLDEGLPELVSAIKTKLKRENNLPPNCEKTENVQDLLGKNVEVIVTPGANAAFMNCVLTLLGENEYAVVFKPYYFNHVMAIQMTRGNDALLVGPIDEDGYPSISWLRQQFHSQSEKQTPKRKIKMVTITNPGNPTGVSIPRSKLQEIVTLCSEHGAWVVFDCTYEQFDHSRANSFDMKTETKTKINTDDKESTLPVPLVGFHCFSDEHVINIFSFSKGYAMAGYRVGYVVLNTRRESGIGRDAFTQMVKVQDTIPICTARITQHGALGALSQGRQWVQQKVKTLDEGRISILDALSPLEKTIGGTGAMYVMGKLPDGVDDMELAEILVEKYGIAIIPGKFCGLPGWIRVCYSNLPPDECKIAASRLKRGLLNLCIKIKS